MISYTSAGASCRGGSLTLKTLQAMQIVGQEPISGALMISAGDATVSISFNSDGSAVANYGNGHTDSFSSAEISAAVANNGC